MGKMQDWKKIVENEGRGHPDPAQESRTYICRGCDAQCDATSEVECPECGEPIAE